MKKKVWLSSPHMGNLELEYVNRAFESNWIAPLGPEVDGFEEDLCKYNGVSHVAALSSGTAALHLALILLNVQAGDEVICQSFTFSASANPILYLNATPVFIGSERDTWNMDPVQLKKAIEDRLLIGKKPKAIIIVHLYGMPAKVDELLYVAAAFNIPVIEDAAEALGSTYKGVKCGSFGKLGIYSFNGNKIITTSGGGALVSESDSIIRQARFLATQSRDPAPHYQHSQVGYNYRLSNICAAIGRGQMQVLDERVVRRRFNYEYYRQSLKAIKGLSFLEEPKDSFSNRWLTTIIVNPAQTNGFTSEDIRLALLQENIESRPLWKPLHLQPVFSNAVYYGDDTAQQLFEQGLCLPSGSNLEVEDLERVAATIKRVATE